MTKRPPRTSDRTEWVTERGFQLLRLLVKQFLSLSHYISVSLLFRAFFHPPSFSVSLVFFLSFIPPLFFTLPFSFFQINNISFYLSLFQSYSSPLCFTIFLHLSQSCCSVVCYFSFSFLLPFWRLMSLVWKQFFEGIQSNKSSWIMNQLQAATVEWKKTSWIKHK